MVTLHARKNQYDGSEKKSRKTWNTLTERISTSACLPVPKLWNLCFQVLCMQWYGWQLTERTNREDKDSIGSIETLPVATTFVYQETWLERQG